MSADTSRLSALRAVAASGLLLVVLGAHVLIRAGAETGPDLPEATRAPLKTGQADARTVVLIMDSMRESNATDPVLMPEMAKLNTTALHGPLKSCFAGFTLPCLLTTFEGRQSPFLTTLSNFSAQATNAPNWLDAVRRRGLRIALISDHTLPELYPGTYVAGGNYEDFGIPVPDRDPWAFQRTFEWLDSGEIDVLIIHIIGTDKVSHAQPPGSPEYNRVFTRADAFVGDVLKRLDTTRDSLVVFGDHGHGPEGHHDRKAWYAAVGPIIAKAAEVPLDQTSMLFLLSRIHGIELPGGYEGDLEWDTLATDPNEAQWLKDQAREWGVTGDATRETLGAELDRRHEALLRRPAELALGFLPWWLHLVLITAALAGALTGAGPLKKGYLAAQAGMLAVAWLLPAWGAWLTLPVQAWLSRPALMGWRGAVPLAAWGVIAFVSGLLIPTIVSFFHVKTGVSWVIGAWFAGIVGVPLALGGGIGQPGARTRIARATLFMLAVALLLPAPGIYYYGVAQNVSHLLFPAAALAIGALCWPLDRMQWVLLAAFGVGAAFMSIEAGGWVWHYQIQNRLMGWPAAAQVTASVVLLGLAGLLWARRKRTSAIAGVILLLIDGALMLTFFDYEGYRVGGFAVLVLSLTGGLQLLESAEDPYRTAWQVALIVGIGFVLGWSTLDGFYVKNMRMDFALHWIADSIQVEAELARAVATLVGIRYFLALIVVLLTAAFAVGAERLLQLAPWVVIACGFKILAQALQTLGVQLVEVEKSSDLLIQEIMGWSVMGLLLWLGAIVIAVWRIIADRRRVAAP